MEVTDLLILCAEVSVALAGFAGIIATFQFRDGKSVKHVELLGLTIIVRISLLDTLICIVPLALLSSGVAESTAWAISSGVGGAVAAPVLYQVNRGLRGRLRRKSIFVYYGFLQITMFAVVVLLLLNLSLIHI